MSEPKLKLRSPNETLNEIAATLKAAALQYGSLALSGDQTATEKAERKLKLAALAFYQASQRDTEDRAISALIALDDEGDDKSDAKQPTLSDTDDTTANGGRLGFADEDLRRW